MNTKPRGKRVKKTDTHKECSMCRELLPHDRFRKRNGPNSTLQSRCKQCESIANKAYRYELPTEDYDALVEELDGRCQLCNKVKPLLIDHDHKCCHKDKLCGKCNRGLICGSCNSRLSRNSEEWIIKAAEYIQSSRL